MNRSDANEVVNAASMRRKLLCSPNLRCRVFVNGEDCLKSETLWHFVEQQRKLCRRSVLAFDCPLFWEINYRTTKKCSTKNGQSCWGILVVSLKSLSFRESFDWDDLMKRCRWTIIVMMFCSVLTLFPNRFWSLSVLLLLAFCSAADIKLLSIISIGPEALSERHCWLRQKLTKKANGYGELTRKLEN